MKNKTISLQSKRCEGGFTLVELAIVMIIIGLLITGVLKGQEMIGNAQVTATVAQIKSLEAATTTFQDMYDAMPGDISTPGTRLPNCATTCAPASGTSPGDGLVNTPAVLGAQVTAGQEAYLFFTHLSAADLITGVSTTPTVATLNFGDEAPTISMGAGGMLAGYTGTGAATGLYGGNMRSGHYLMIRPGFAAMATTAGTASMTPSQAARIDRKVDDGAPNSGTVRAGGSSGTGTAVCSAITAGAVYAEANQGSECNLFIRIQN